MSKETPLQLPAATSSTLLPIRTCAAIESAAAAIGNLPTLDGTACDHHHAFLALTTNIGLTAPSTGLRRLACPALKNSAAAIRDCAALRPFILAGGPLTITGTAYVGLASPSTCLRGLASAALEHVSTAVLDLPAIGPFVLTGRRRTTADILLASTTACLRLLADSALEYLSTSIGDKPTISAYLLAGDRLTGLFPANVRSATAADLIPFTLTTVDDVVATIHDEATFGADILAGEGLARIISVVPIVPIVPVVAVPIVVVSYEEAAAEGWTGCQAQCERQGENAKEPFSAIGEHRQRSYSKGISWDSCWLGSKLMQRFFFPERANQVILEEYVPQPRHVKWSLEAK